MKHKHCGMHWFEIDPHRGGGVRPRGVVWVYDTLHEQYEGVLSALERAGFLLTARFHRGPMSWWHGNAIPGLYPVTVIWERKAIGSKTVLIIHGPPSSESDAEKVVNIISRMAYYLGAPPMQHAPGVDLPDNALEQAYYKAYKDIVMQMSSPTPRAADSPPASR